MAQPSSTFITKLDRHSTLYPLIDSKEFRGALLGQVAVVTGAGRGIGKAIALAFAEAGANVACVSRTPKELEDLVLQIAKLGFPRAISICADLSSETGVVDVVTKIKKAFGTIRILVNNAGLDRIGSMQHEPDFSSWWRVFEVNLKAPAALTREILPDMIAENKGTIIHIGSRNAIYNFPFMTAYSASKTALLRFHQCLHLELQDTNVQTFYLQPGDVATSLMNNSAINIEEMTKEPQLQLMVKNMQERMTEGRSDNPQLAANTCVALAALPDSYLLSGLYLDATHDLGQMLADLRKGKESMIRKWELYSLKADLL